MNRERLLRLADYLDTVPPERFDLANWRVETAGCGTVACALGHACDIREFRDDGLRLVGPYRIGGELRYGIEYRTKPEQHGFTAAAAFFDVKYAESIYLFDRNAYARRDNPKLVVARIRGFVAKAAAP